MHRKEIPSVAGNLSWKARTLNTSKMTIHDQLIIPIAEDAANLLQILHQAIVTGDSVQKILGEVIAVLPPKKYPEIEWKLVLAMDWLSDVELSITEFNSRTIAPEKSPPITNHCEDQTEETQ
jgi:hypothetical protein